MASKKASTIKPEGGTTTKKVSREIQLQIYQTFMGFIIAQQQSGLVENLSLEQLASIFSEGADTSYDSVWETYLAIWAHGSGSIHDRTKSILDAVIAKFSVPVARSEHESSTNTIVNTAAPSPGAPNNSILKLTPLNPIKKEGASPTMPGTKSKPPPRPAIVDTATLKQKLPSSHQQLTNPANKNLDRDLSTFASSSTSTQLAPPTPDSTNNVITTTSPNPSYIMPPPPNPTTSHSPSWYSTSAATQPPVYPASTTGMNISNLRTVPSSPVQGFETPASAGQGHIDDDDYHSSAGIPTGPSGNDLVEAVQRSIPSPAAASGSNTNDEASSRFLASAGVTGLFSTSNVLNQSSYHHPASTDNDGTFVPGSQMRKDEIAMTGPLGYSTTSSTTPSSYNPNLMFDDGAQFGSVGNSGNDGGMGPGMLTGSYWRTAASLEERQLPSNFSISSSNNGYRPSYQTASNPNKDELELPPVHIVNHLLDIHYAHVHPIFPFLPVRPVITPSTPGTPLLLALCAYNGRLSPSFGVNPGPAALMSSAGNDSSRDDAGRIASDLWYEQARNGIGKGLRGRSDIEMVQTLILLALRDQGKGNESQAWLLLGMAVRIAQDLGLHTGSGSLPKRKEDDVTVREERQTRRQVWGTIMILDIFLSLQLGRPSAIIDGQFDSDPLLASTLNNTASTSHVHPGRVAPKNTFCQTVSLCQILSRINFHLYVKPATNKNPGEVGGNVEMLNRLKAELDQWQYTLPTQARVSIGNRSVPLDVLDLNLLYHAAVILLYRPFRKNRAVQSVESSLDAASTFNILLESYRTSQGFRHSNPHLIYLIFTSAIAHLSGLRLLEEDKVSHAKTMEAQVHLLQDFEALKALGITWALAGRCFSTLDALMEKDGMKPNAGLLVNRNGGSSNVNTVNSGNSTKRRREGEISSSDGGQTAKQRRSSNAVGNGGVGGGVSTLDPSIIGSSPKYNLNSPSYAPQSQQVYSSGGQQQQHQQSSPQSHQIPQYLQPSSNAYSHNLNNTNGSISSNTQSNQLIGNNNTGDNTINTMILDDFFDSEFFSNSTGWLAPRDTVSGSSNTQNVNSNNMYWGGLGSLGQLPVGDDDDLLTQLLAGFSNNTSNF